MINRLFVYGTLMFPELFEAITGRLPRFAPARLYGYRRRQVKGKDYPAIVPVATPFADKVWVNGVVYHELNKSTLNLLDHYEDYFYSRVLVSAITPERKSVRVWVYAIKHRAQDRLAQHDWDPEYFAQHILASYLKRYRKQPQHRSNRYL